MPPMIDGPFLELVPRMKTNLIQCPLRLDSQPEEAVLQLITETVGAAGLIIGSAPPHSSRDSLVFQPPVLHQVHRMVRRFRHYAIKMARPMAMHFLQCRLDLPGFAIFKDEPFGLRPGIRGTESEKECLRFARFERDG